MSEISLLIGNGFNRLEDSDFPNWDSLIKTPISEMSDFVDIKNMPYPLKFEYIMNFYNHKNGMYSSDAYNEVKMQISKRLNQSILKSDKKIDKEISSLLCAIAPQNILTTNYDCLLEKVFISKGSKANYSEYFNEINKNREFFLNRTRCLGKGDKKTNFYHVHGIDSIPNSICLGYEHYMRIVTKLRQRLIGEKDIRIIEYLEDKNKLGKDFSNEYETKFFDTDMYIVGLGLSSEEIDLWWILCYRAYLYYANIKGAKELIKNKIVYYDVHPIKTTSDGYSYEDDYIKQQKELFKYMNIEYIDLKVENQDFKDAYVKALNNIKERIK